MFEITKHLTERVNKRLNGLITAQEVINRLNACTINPRIKTAIEIKRIQYTEIRDDSIFPDGIARGDSIIAIVLDGRIITVCLRKTWSQTGLYRLIKFNQFRAY